MIGVYNGAAVLSVEVGEIMSVIQVAASSVRPTKASGSTVYVSQPDVT